MKHTFLSILLTHVFMLPFFGFCVDTDKDRLSDEKELEFGTDPNNPDSDGDGLLDGEEARILRTNPISADTDGDGLTDGWEIGADRYTYVNRQVTWEQANLESNQHDKGHLATITSLYEQKIIQDILNDQRKGIDDPDWNNAHNPFLGGVKDINGNFQWVTGEEFSYRKFAPGEPNNYEGSEPYLAIGYWVDFNQWFWNDYRNDSSSYSWSENEWNENNWVSWGRAYILEIGYPSDPTKSDTDGDGYDDYEEYEYNTDPNNTDSIPEKLKILPSTNSIELDFGTTEGNTYQLYFSSNFKDWVSYQEPIEGTGGKVGIFVSITNSDMKFFRLYRIIDLVR